MSPKDLVGRSDDNVLRVSSGGAGVTLEPMSVQVAEALGPAFAAIDPWLSYPYPASALTAYFSTVEPGAPRYALRVEGNSAGAIGIRDNWLRGPYLQFLGVLPQYQRQGIGELVLEWFEARASAAHERNLWVAASDFNGHAIAFYERHGFMRVASLDGLVRDGTTEILLRKRH